MIRKVRNKRLWKVVSHTTGRVLGTYKTKSAANVRLKQVEMFKHMRKR